MSRRVGNWLKGFMYYTQANEAPDSYLRWCAVSAIAGATQRRVSIRWVYSEVYLNMYVVLTGPPGIGKNRSIRHVREILTYVGVPMTSESISKSALITQMQKRGDTDKATISILANELGSFLEVSGPAMSEFLTDVFDSHDIWEATTQSRGEELLKNVFVNMLAGTTPRWIADNFDPSFLDKGFASRTLFVYENQPRFRKAFPKVTKEMMKMRDHLIDDLAAIADIRGTFEWTPEAQAWFEQWYETRFPKEERDIDYKLSSYHTRKPLMLLKCAVVLSLAESDELLLEAEQLKEAKRMLDATEPGMVKALAGVGRNIYASDSERICGEILTNGGMSDWQVRRRNNHAMSKQMLDETLESLELMGYVRRDLRDNEIWYVPAGG